MKELVVVISILFIFFSRIQAQPYVDGGQTRHRFAQLNLGVDLRHISGSATRSYTLMSDNTYREKTLDPSTEPRLVIGGTHFWGHADFYVALPLASIGNSGFKTGAETGMRAYPWRIESGKIRPFVGLSWIVTSFKAGDGTKQTHTRLPFQFGFTYAQGNHLFELNSGFFRKNQENYYFHTQHAPMQVDLPNMWLGIGYKYLLETTTSAEWDWESGQAQRRTEYLAKQNKLNGFNIGVGPSSTILYKSSPHNDENAPYLGEHKMWTLLPEVTLGYYIHRPDIQIQLAWRDMHGTLEAYGHRQTMRRQSVALEAYKFLFDYHGFVPFVGPSLSFERRTLTETGGPADYSVSVQDYKPGLTFGWDIRPTRLMTWYLRSHLRWFPNLGVTAPTTGLQVRMDQVEFNYIQLVVFPGRMIRARSIGML